MELSQEEIDEIIAEVAEIDKEQRKNGNKPRPFEEVANEIMEVFKDYGIEVPDYRRI